MQQEQPGNEQKGTDYRPYERSGRKRVSVNYRSLGELVRGLFFILFGLYAFYGEFAVSRIILNILGGILIAYGLFRVYRGVKNTFSKND